MEKNINTIQNSDLNNGTLFVLQNVDITGISRDLSIAFWNSKFVYDNLDRMTTAQYGEGTSLSDNINHYTENITGYTKNGAITGLQRYGKTTNNDYGLIDNLTYTLSGNELKKVTNASTNIPANNGMHFVDGANQDTEYTYDANGNLTQDLNKGINITYNVLDLPNTLTTQSGTVNYLYTADGVKRQVKHGTSTTDYADNLVYENGKLSKILTAEGYITLDSLNKPTYHYYLKDHEGNNRVVIDQNGTVEQVNHYYPFGTLFSESTNTATQRYKYNGKELDTDYGLNLYDYGARYYDPILGQFTTSDRYAEKYNNFSPYQYGANNPINTIDINGDSLKVTKEAIETIYSGLNNNQNLSMQVKNGMIVPESIKGQAANSDDYFLKDLYEIANDEKIVEMSVASSYDYKDNNGIIKNSNKDFSDPDKSAPPFGPIYNDYDKVNGNLKWTVSGNLGRTLVPGNINPTGANSTNQNIQLIISSWGTLAQREIGAAHEFGHIILYLHSGGKVFRHGEPGVNKEINKRTEQMYKKIMGL